MTTLVRLNRLQLGLGVGQEPLLPLVHILLLLVVVQSLTEMLQSYLFYFRIELKSESKYLFLLYFDF